MTCIEKFSVDGVAAIDWRSAVFRVADGCAGLGISE